MWDRALDGDMQQQGMLGCVTFLALSLQPSIGGGLAIKQAAVN